MDRFVSAYDFLGGVSRDPGLIKANDADRAIISISDGPARRVEPINLL